ncbi:polysaccharide polymerase [Streptococcus sp.]|nr:polysaccharide polymerase [Streptococcus sp.]MDY3823382.1 polysaccharide polymerase [Streptococcus sp.]
MKTYKIIPSDILLIFGLSIILITETINTTMLSGILPEKFYLINLIAALLLLMRFLFIKKYNLIDLFFMIAFLGVGLILLAKIKHPYLFVYILLFIGLYGADIERILKIYIISVGSVVGLTFVLSLLGVIPNLVFIQYRGVEQVRRISFGSVYPTDFASHCFYLYTAASYLYRQKHIWIRTIFGFVLSAFIVIFCNARLNAMSILTIDLIFLWYYFKPEFKPTKFLSLLYPIAATFIYSVSETFDNGIEWYRQLNTLFSNRLYLGKLAFETYDIKLFGDPTVRFVGFGGNTDATSIEYNYVDSSYLKLMFMYGVVFVAMIVLYLTMKSFALHTSKNYLLFTIVVFIAINCTFEAFIISPAYNIFFYVLLGTSLYDKSRSHSSGVDEILSRRKLF